MSVTIRYVHEKYLLLTIDPVKLKTTIQPADIVTKSSTGPLLKHHYSYICGAWYYFPTIQWSLQQFSTRHSQHNLLPYISF